MAFQCFAVALAIMTFVPSEAVDASAMANPIRKVVTMLKAVQAKVEEEGKKEEALYTKYMCYCSSSSGDLQKSVAGSEAKVPEVQSQIEESEAQKVQTDDDLVKHKADRDANKRAMADATALRNKEAAAFASEKADVDSDVAALNAAVAALEKGMAGAFLQTGAADVLRRVVQSTDAMVDGDRQEVLAFLSASQGSEYAPQSGEITGLLKQLGDEMGRDLTEATTAEEAAIKNYAELMAAKKRENTAATAAIETKTVRSGELAVSIVNMKDDLSDTETALMEDKAFLADLAKNCDTKTAEWNEIVKTRAAENLALAETIKLLNDDDALELFKKTLPSPAASLIQVKERAASTRSRALALIRGEQQTSKSASLQLNFIALALQGKSQGFEKVLAMIDEMVKLLGNEQVDDDSLKIYCNTEFDATDDKTKALKRSIADSETSIAAAEGSIDTLTNEIKALVAGIKALDASVTEATEQRKQENSDFTELMAQDTAAKELLGVARNRLNAFYNPKLHVAAPKRELSAEDRVVVNFGGTAAPTPAPGGISGTGIAVLAQVSAHVQQKAAQNVAPPPAPEAPGAYSKKSEESNGVIAMLDLLVKDLDKEMTVAQAEEKNAQGDYEQLMKDSAAKRAADSKTVSEKQGVKADTQAALQAHNGEKASTSAELAATLETIQALHSECDWLLQYFDVRKEARASEIDSLGKAKAVLSGADYSLLQTRVRSLRGRE